MEWSAIQAAFDRHMNIIAARKEAEPDKLGDLLIGESAVTLFMMELMAVRQANAA